MAVVEPAIAFNPIALATPASLYPLSKTNSQQLLQSGTEPNKYGGPKDLLVISPYTEEPHLLDLQSLEPQPQLLALALTELTSMKEDYATTPYTEIFNWAEVIGTLQQLSKVRGHYWIEQTFYIVVFRSQILATTGYPHLGALDKAAHAEAMKSGGFLKYWFGSPNQQGRNLATCVWRTREDARLGGMGPAHRQAAGAARHLYTEWTIERLGLLIKDGAEEWEIIPWTDKA